MSFDADHEGARREKLFSPEKFLVDKAFKPQCGFSTAEPESQLALLKIHELLPAAPASMFLLVPRGLEAKTEVVAMSPFMMSSHKTLVICQTMKLAIAMRNRLSTTYSRGGIGNILERERRAAAIRLGVASFARAGKPFVTTLGGFPPYHHNDYHFNMMSSNAEVVVTHMNEMSDTPKGAGLSRNAQRLLGEWAPDLIIFDEQRNSMLDCWTRVHSTFDATKGHKWKYLMLGADCKKLPAWVYGMSQHESGAWKKWWANAIGLQAL
jgi:hypothetical protein